MAGVRPLFRSRLKDYNDMITNAMTIDLEDYFHVSAYADRIGVDDWSGCAQRLESSTAQVLDLLSAAGCKATFFTLGWVAIKYPRLVREIVDAGHEIACHSHEHRLVYQMKAETFREDTRQAKQALEDACGQPVLGYRAPSFSIRKDALWAFEILVELGFRYDSSIFPIEHFSYGIPNAPRFPFLVQTSSGSLVEFPMPTIELNGQRSPLGGGAYLRMLPYQYTRWGIRFINEQEHQPVCIYVHPWELDPEQPRLEGSFTARLRQCFGLRGTKGKLQRLLGDFAFCPLGALVAQQQALKFEIIA